MTTESAKRPRHKFPVGNHANPAGRPPRAVKLEALLEEALPAVAEKAIEAALSGDMAAVIAVLRFAAALNKVEPMTFLSLARPEATETDVVAAQDGQEGTPCAASGLDSRRRNRRSQARSRQGEVAG